MPRREILGKSDMLSYYFLFWNTTFKVPFTGQSLLDIDSLLAFLSTEYPGIPPHIRRSPTGGKHPDNTIDQNGSIGQALEMIRSFEGRSVSIDLRYLGFGKLLELINKCKQVVSFLCFSLTFFPFLLFFQNYPWKLWTFKLRMRSYDSMI